MALEELQNGRYRFLRLIGSGGMGEVYLMNDTRVSRQVAIKVIRSEGASYSGSQSAKDAARLFQREAKAIAALEHPNILPLYDFGEETHEDITASYMVMPYCPEGSLAGWLRQSSSAALTPQDLAQLVEQAADALQYAHDHQVIHLDVKPSNFLIRGNRKNPNCPTLLLADFGIARSSTTASSSSRTIRGTPTSMAPEQWSSMTVPATDQYGLAVMVYEILAGRPPFVGGMEQLMYQHFSVQPPPPSNYNPNVGPDRRIFRIQLEPAFQAGLGIRRDRVGRALRLAHAAIDALFRMDHEHVLALVEAVDGADLDAVHVLALDAGFVDDVGHGFSPLTP